MAKNSQLKLDDSRFGDNEELIRKFQQTGYLGFRDRVILNNQRLIRKIAFRYYGLGEPIEDLVQEGNIGLMRAVDKYNPDGVASFATYAFYWVRQAIGYYLAKNRRLIREPFYHQQLFFQINRAEAILTQLEGRKPTTAEIAEFLNVPREVAEKTVHHHWVIQSVSADALLGDDHSGTDRTLWDLLPDVSLKDIAEETENRLTRQQLQRKIRQAVKTLAPEERAVIVGVFWCDSSKQDVAKMMSFSPSKIHRLFNSALEKLRLILEDQLKGEDVLSYPCATEGCGRRISEEDWQKLDFSRITKERRFCRFCNRHSQFEMAYKTLWRWRLRSREGYVVQNPGAILWNEGIEPIYLQRLRQAGLVVEIESNLTDWIINPADFSQSVTLGRNGSDVDSF